MKRLCSVLFVLLFSMLVPCGQGQDIPQLKVRRVKNPLDFSRHLDGPALWELRGAGKVSLKMDGESTVFLQNGDQEVFRLKAPEYVENAVLSENGSSLMISVSKTEDGGSNFAYLVRVQAEAHKVKVDRVLEDGQKLFGERRWWISELGAVSNDSTKVLAKLGVMGEMEPDGSTRVFYKWYTVEVLTGKILSEGLTMANSKTPGIK